MEQLINNPAFQTYALCSAILAIKMLLDGNYTTLQRFRTKTYLTEEDTRQLGGTVGDNPNVARAMNIHRNDMENIPVFWIVALIYVLQGASPGAAAAYCWTFTIARLVHWAAYINELQPFRAIAYFVGYLATLGMAVQIIF